MTKKLNELFNLPDNNSMPIEQTDIFLEQQIGRAHV